MGGLMLIVGIQGYEAVAISDWNQYMIPKLADHLD